MPKCVEIDEASATDRYAKFTASPFQSGFGHTIGNSIRRILLSSLEGDAISSLKIDGVQHEFASIPNVVEDLTEIVLNIKKIRLISHSGGSRTLEIRKDKAGAVTAADIVTDGTVTVLNPEQIICTLDKDFAFRAEIEIKRGKGWIPADKNKKADQIIGTIAVDSLFTPVTRVKYSVGLARVGEETEMDSLALEIWTDGRIAPKDALENASKILQLHLKPFLGSLAGEESALASITDEEKKLYKVLVQNVDTIELSVRAQNCLRNANIKLIGDLCMKTEQKMLKYRNFGKKSLEEIKLKLESMGLGLGMTFSAEMIGLIQEESKKLQSEEEQEA